MGTNQTEGESFAWPVIIAGERRYNAATVHMLSFQLWQMWSQDS